jgi:hypothetical protein
MSSVGSLAPPLFCAECRRGRVRSLLRRAAAVAFRAHGRSATGLRANIPALGLRNRKPLRRGGKSASPRASFCGRSWGWLRRFSQPQPSVVPAARPRLGPILFPLKNKRIPFDRPSSPVMNAAFEGCPTRTSGTEKKAVSDASVMSQLPASAKSGGTVDRRDQGLGEFADGREERAVNGPEPSRDRRPPTRARRRPPDRRPRRKSGRLPPGRRPAPPRAPVAVGISSCGCGAYLARSWSSALNQFSMWYTRTILPSLRCTAE